MTHTHIGMLGVEVVLEIIVRKFVAVFKFTIVLRFFLNRIVSQMHQFVWQIVNAEFSRWGPQVALLVEIAFSAAIHTSH